MDRTLRLAWRRLQEPVVFWIAAALLVVATLFPLAILAAQYVQGGGAWAQASAVLARPRTWQLLFESLALATAVTTIAALVGIPLGVLLGRTDVVGRRLALALYVLPMFLPPLLIALGWFHLLGQHGYLGSAATSALLFGRVGLVAILGLTFSPVVAVLVMLALSRVDPTLEEAACVMASPRRAVIGVLVPLAWPAIALALIIVFALAFSELGVAMFLRVRTYPAAVFARLGGVAYAPGEAFALVLPLLAVALGLLVVERRFIGRRSFAALGNRGSERRVFELGRWRLPATVAVWCVVGLALAPLLALFARAGLGGFSAASRWLGDSVTNSLVTAVAAASIITVLAVVVGHALARRRRGSALIDGAAMFAFFTPAGVLGVAIIATWNRPATAIVYSTVAIIVVGLVARYAVVGLRTVAVVVSQSPVELEQAAATCGGGFMRSFTRIVLPLHARGLVAAWLIVLVFCLRDLATVVNFYPPGGETLPVRIFTLEANGPEEVVAALAAVHVAVTSIVVAIGAALLLWRRPV